MPRPRKNRIKTKKQKQKGNFNQPSQLCFYRSIPELVHTPLLDFEREHNYTRSNTSTLARKHIISIIKIMGVYMVAICPEYKDHDPKKLLDLL